MPKEQQKSQKEPSDFVKLAGTLGGIFLVITVLFVLFTREQVVFLMSIAWAFVVLGIVLGAFMLKAQQNQKNQKKR